MRFPRTEADPAEVVFAVLVLADHVIATTVLFDRHEALRALLRVRRDPVGRLAVVVALLLPLLQQLALNRLVPLVGALEAEHRLAGALDRLTVQVADLDYGGALRLRAPAQQAVALDEAVRDQVLVLQLHFGVGDQVHDRLVVHQNVTVGRGARDRVAHALLHDLRGQVVHPAVLAEPMLAVQTGQLLGRQVEVADLAALQSVL